MPPLIEKWNQLRDTDKDLFPLLEVCSAFVLSVKIRYKSHTRSAFVGQSGDLTAVVSPGCQDDAVPGSIY